MWNALNSIFNCYFSLVWAKIIKHAARASHSFTAAREENSPDPVLSTSREKWWKRGSEVWKKCTPGKGSGFGLGLLSYPWLLTHVFIGIISIWPRLFTRLEQPEKASAWEMLSSLVPLCCFQHTCSSNAPHRLIDIHSGSQRKWLSRVSAAMSKPRNVCRTGADKSGGNQHCSWAELFGFKPACQEVFSLPRTKDGDGWERRCRASRNQSLPVFSFPYSMYSKDAESVSVNMHVSLNRTLWCIKWCCRLQSVHVL